jgi:hypothetical protein
MESFLVAKLSDISKGQMLVILHLSELLARVGEKGHESLTLLDGFVHICTWVAKPTA